jgi:hypothetical protein
MTTLAAKLRVGVAGTLLAVSSAVHAQGSPVPRLAVRLDPVSAIIEALQTHQVVALGEWHYNLQLHALRLKLLRDPRLPDVVSDIVVEFGSQKHQEIIDRYTSGVDVPHDELRRAWVEVAGTVGGGWDGAVYEEFYVAVREVNTRLPENRRIRVVLGGDPTPFTMEGEASLIKRAVTDQGRNALILWGAMHLPRKPLFYPVSDAKFAEFVYSHPDSVSTVAHLVAAGISVFSIWPKATDEFLAVQPDIEKWEMPALAVVKDTVLGIEPFATFANTDTTLSVPDGDGKGMHQEHVAPDPTRSGLMQEQFDAVLLLGPESSLREGHPYNATPTD